jgi:hypothetical protein
MISRWSTLVMALAALAVVGSQTAWAQSRSSRSTTGSSSQGLFGTQTVGSSSNFATPTGSTGGTQNSGSSSGGNSGNSFGGGSGGGAAQDPFAQQNVASQARGPQIQTTQQRGVFVGADSADTTNARSLQGTNTRGQFGANNGLAQLQNLFQQGLQNINQGNQQGAQVQIPVSLKLGFTPQPVNSTRVQAFATRLTRLPSIRFVGPASVTMEGRTAVLRGKVLTEEDRELAQALALMEPDVTDVRNELTVDTSATTAEELPAAPVPAPQ